MKGRQTEIIPPAVLLEAYTNGYFPMSDHRNDTEVQWYTARKRGVIPLDGFHLSRRMERKRKTLSYRWSVNECFDAVIHHCAERESTWISPVIIRSFMKLYELGYAHSVEVHVENQLAAGLYGVAIRGAFFAESMFQLKEDTGKFALYHCHRHLKNQGYTLWDVQFYTPHLGQFGCIEISRAEYEQRLMKALKVPAKFVN